MNSNQTLQANIHSSAIIHKNALIGNNVTIGAYSIVDAHVVIGDNTIIGNHVNLTGHTTLGKNNHIFHYASIGERPQDKKYNNEPTRLIIGDNNTIREYCTLNTGTVSSDGQTNGTTRIGNNNWLMAYSHVAHDCLVGNNTIFANSVSLGGHVTIKDWVVLGGHSVVHQFCLIGEHAMIAGTTGVDRDVPPYVMAFGYRAEPKGINSEGLKRRGFTSTQIDNIRQAYRVLYRNGLTFGDAKSYINELALEQPELRVFVEFFTTSSRGIIR